MLEKTKGNALRKYLRSRVGEPWNDIYSALCAKFNRRKTMDYFVFKDLGWMVKLNCEVVDGLVYEIRTYRHCNKLPVEGLFVHPETGILCHNEPRTIRMIVKEKKAKKEITRFDFGGLDVFEKTDGLWYRLTYQRPDPEEVIRRHCWEEFSSIPWPRCEELRAKYGLCKPGDVALVRRKDTVLPDTPKLVHKKQCNKRELQIVARAIHELKNGKQRPEFIYRWDKLRQHAAQVSNHRPGKQTRMPQASAAPQIREYIGPDPVYGSPIF